MKLSTPITDDQRKALEKAQRSLKSLLARPAAVKKKVAGLREMEAKVTVAIEKLEEEAEDGANEVAITKLGPKREQLRLLQRSIERGEEEMEDSFFISARESINKAHQATGGLFSEMATEHLKYLVGLLEPFCNNRGEAEAFAKRMASLQHISGHAAMMFSGVFQSVSQVTYQAQRTLSHIDGFLSGGDVLPDLLEVKKSKGL